jgi:hypothetical protein
MNVVASVGSSPARKKYSTSDALKTGRRAKKKGVLRISVIWEVVIYYLFEGLSLISAFSIIAYAMLQKKILLPFTDSPSGAFRQPCNP